jgi:hypothetical protein
MKPIVYYFLIVPFFLLTASGCSSKFVTTTPDGFATYKQTTIFKSVSPDHVVYRIRTVKNEPYANFDFWKEALPERMKNAGYRVIRDSVVTNNIKDNALLLEMAAPIGTADYSYFVMMMVKDKQILIAEAAGQYADFQNRKASIIAALKKTALK